MLRLAADAGAALTATLFVAPPAGTLSAVTLDTMTAIYDRRSGQTHLVAEIVPALLDALRDDALDVAALAARLDVAEAAAIVAERLAELVASGLVEAR